MSDPIVPDKIDPKNPGMRSKASRLRGMVRRGDQLSPEQIAWLEDYDRAQRNSAFSATHRTVHVEESAVAAGTGAAAEVAASAAMAREDGRRLDYLLRGGMDALTKACDMYEKMTRALLDRTATLEAAHVSMLEAVREQYLLRTQAEVNAIQADADGDGDLKAIVSMLAQRFLTAADVSPKQ